VPVAARVEPATPVELFHTRIFGGGVETQQGQAVGVDRRAGGDVFLENGDHRHRREVRQHHHPDATRTDRDRATVLQLSASFYPRLWTTNPGVIDFDLPVQGSQAALTIARLPMDASAEAHRRTSSRAASRSRSATRSRLISTDCQASRSPVASAAGLPIGLEISGPPVGESMVLALAHAYEQAPEWHGARRRCDAGRVDVRLKRDATAEWRPSDWH